MTWHSIIAARSRGGSSGLNPQQAALPMRIHQVPENIQKPADNANAPQNPFYRRIGSSSETRRSSRGVSGTHQLCSYESRAQQEDPVPLPQVLQNLRGVVRAPEALWPKALGGREALRLPQMWEEVPCWSWCAWPREALWRAHRLHLWHEIRIQVQPRCS